MIPRLPFPVSRLQTVAKMPRLLVLAVLPVTGCFVVTPRSVHFHRPSERRVSAAVKLSVQRAAETEKFASGFEDRAPNGGGVDLTGHWAPDRLRGLSFGACAGSNCGVEPELAYDHRLPGPFLPVGAFGFASVRAAGAGLSGGIAVAGDRRDRLGAVSLEVNATLSWTAEVYEAPEVHRSGSIQEPADAPIADIRTTSVRIAAPVAVGWALGKYHILVGAEIPWQLWRGGSQYNIFHGPDDGADPPDDVRLERSGVSWTAWLDIGASWN